MEDSRGILRGTCQACPCQGYVRPEGGMKCGKCAHPPGKHSSLTAASSGGDSSTSVEHSPQPSNGGDSSTSAKDLPQPGNGGHLSTPVDLPVPRRRRRSRGGTQSTQQSIGSLHTPSHSELVHDLSQTPQTPSSSLQHNSVISTKGLSGSQSKSSKSPSRLRGATTSSFGTPVDVNDADEDLIDSIKRTTIRSRSMKPPSDAGSLFLKPVSSPKQAWPAAESSPSTRRRKTDTSPFSRVLQQRRDDSSSSEPAIEVPEELLCVGCHKKKKSQKENGDYFDYCGISCRDYYQRRGGKGYSSRTPGSQPSCIRCGKPCIYTRRDGTYHDYCGKTCHNAAQLLNSSVMPPIGSDGVSASDVSICSSSDTHCTTLFQSMWAPQKGACPRVDYVYTITNSHLEDQFQYFKQKMVKVLGTEEHFHGTSLKCNLARSSSLCLDRSCGVCSISRYGFNSSLIGTNVSFQRFGPGFYLARNSSKCHDYTQGSPDSGHRALILCEVCPGRKYTLQKTNEALTGPPPGYDCVGGDVGRDLNYPEIVFYNSQPILPKYIILYKLNGVQKLVR